MFDYIYPGSFRGRHCGGTGVDIPLLPFPVRRILPCEQIPISSVTVQNPPALLLQGSVCPLPICQVADAAVSAFSASAGSKGITH